MSEVANADTFKARTGGLAMAGIILAFCLQPLFPHANRSGLAWGGFLIAAAAFAFYQLDVRPTLDQRLRWIVATPLAVVGTVFLIVTFAAAIGTAEDFDAACRMQERRMMYDDTSAARPGDAPATGHDTYSAMQCRWVPVSRPKATLGRSSGSTVPAS